MSIEILAGKSALTMEPETNGTAVQHQPTELE